MKIKKEVKVGLVVVAAVGFLIYGVNYLKGIDLFKTGRKFYTTYDNVSGLTSASPVVFKGMKVGQVISAELQGSNGKYFNLVTFAITNDALEFPTDSKAMMVSMDVFGTKGIEIVPGNGKKFAVEGDTIFSDAQQTLTERIDAEVAPLKAKVEGLLGSLDTMISGVSKVLGTNQDALAQSIINLEVSLRNLKQFSDKVNVLMDSESGKISSILAKVESITGNIQKNNASIDKTIDNIASISDSLAKVDLPSTVRSLKKSVDEVNTMLGAINKGEGTMGALMHDDSLYNSIVQTNAQLNALIKSITENPERYLHFSVIGRKPK